MEESRKCGRVLVIGYADGIRALVPVTVVLFKVVSLGERDQTKGFAVVGLGRMEYWKPNWPIARNGSSSFAPSAGGYLWLWWFSFT